MPRWFFCRLSLSHFSASLTASLMPWSTSAGPIEVETSQVWNKNVSKNSWRSQIGGEINESNVKQLKLFIVPIFFWHRKKNFRIYFAVKAIARAFFTLSLVPDSIKSLVKWIKLDYLIMTSASQSRLLAVVCLLVLKIWKLYLIIFGGIAFILLWKNSFSAANR